MLQFILSKTLNHHPKDILEKTPLHLAAENGRIDCVKSPVETGPLHINDADITSNTPLHAAARIGHK